SNDTATRANVTPRITNAGQPSVLLRCAWAASPERGKPAPGDAAECAEQEARHQAEDDQVEERTGQGLVRDVGGEVRRAVRRPTFGVFADHEGIAQQEAHPDDD